MHALPLPPDADSRVLSGDPEGAHVPHSGWGVRGVAQQLASHEEGEWVAGIQSGDPAAFEAMFRAYYRPLRAFALAQVRDAATVDEIVQDVLCWVWQHRTAWRIHTSLKTYLFGAVRNRALNHARRERLALQWELNTAAATRARPEAAYAEPADARVIEDDFGRALRRAVDALPTRCREAYLLRWLHHRSYKDIAGEMGTSVKTVEIHIAKALKVLRRALADFA
jgi:RNA polymerase sigma-70 factor, ECF subfamily